MKKLGKIALFGFFLLSLTACTQAYRVHVKEVRAERELRELTSAIQSGNADSVWIVSRRSPDIHYLIFHAGRVTFWSDNSLTAPAIYIPHYDGWYDDDFSNAYCRCRWTKVDDYQIQTVIPIKWTLNEDARKEIANSFSYQPLLTGSTSIGERHWLSAKSQVRVFFWIIFFVFSAIIIGCLVTLIQVRGYKNLPLNMKIQYLTLAVLLLSFVGIFIISILYIPKHYRARQEAELRQKCDFVQAALQNLYFWDFSDQTISSSSLSTDLRDLAYAYGTDIHVYDLRGHLIGSSTPSLFEHRLLSTFIAPEVMFSKKPIQTFYSSIGDMRYLSATTDFINGSYMQLGYIVLPSFISQEAIAQEVNAFWSRILPVYIAVLLIGILLAIGLSRALMAPLKTMTDKMRTLSLDDPNAHVTYAYNDEIGELISHYNDMIDELARSSRQLARSEREGAWRTMARQIAHEINNPLTPMKLTVQQLQRLKGTERFDAEFDKATDMLVAQIDNLSRIATSFSTFAKQPEIHATEVDVAQKLSIIITLCTNNPEGIPIRYIGPDEGVWARADNEQLGQVFTNIIRNAVQAIGDDPKGDIIVILKNDPSKDEVEISISDNGPGIPEEVQSKIFLPNFTTKSTGTGLGLAISKNIIEGADGRICFETSKKGTTFFVYLQKIY